MVLLLHVKLKKPKLKIFVNTIFACKSVGIAINEKENEKKSV